MISYVGRGAGYSVGVSLRFSRRPWHSHDSSVGNGVSAIWRFYRL